MRLIRWYQVTGVIYLLGLIACKSSQQDLQPQLLPRPTDWAQKHLKQKVQRMAERSYKITTNTSGDSLILDKEQELQFSKSGYCTALSFSARGGKILRKRLLEYNPAQQLIKESHYLQERSESEITITYQYNQTGLLRYQEYYSRGNLINTTTFEYTDLPGIRTATTKNPEGVIIATQTAQLNSQGQLLSEQRFKNNNLSIQEAKVYDRTGNLLQQSMYRPVGNSFIVTEFNTQTYPTVVKQYRDGLLQSTCVYAFNEQQDPAQEACQLRDTTKVNPPLDFLYEYDAQQNWTKQVQKRAGKVVYVVEREYDYYQ